jgi:protein-S-isoprenylcysteine O-methyltransferase Ste14
MARFIVLEFYGFEREFFTIDSDIYNKMNWYEQYRHWYLIAFHLIFTIDVSIGIIGYSFASRWLDNRTRSVDATMSGWVVALLCYPPLNTGFTAQFISYGGLDTHLIVKDPYYLTAILILLFILYSIYVWATITLGFKFSNLTNRGIVTSGPYKYVRHPAYIAKNLSWWIDNTYVLTNIWAIVAMSLWNSIYILRALTEERHLKKDSEYGQYCAKVNYRFIPKVI